jgi:hypothetical protein
MRRAVIAGLGAAVVALSSVGLGAGAANGDTFAPHRWCPGDPKNMPYIVNDGVDWDWSICHTWYPTNYGMGNVTMHGQPFALWDGDNPPAEAITRRTCPPIAFMCP